MIPYTRDWIAVHRTHQSNLRLGATLSFVAGAINAGGFLAVGQYTSHMTGVLSSVADHLALGEFLLALAGLVALMTFVAGAMTTALLVNWGLRRDLWSAYGLPLLAESLLLLVFGLFGAGINRVGGHLVPLTVLILCFIMGLQNAVITKISKAEIRTTHVTGLMTDLGIELGRLVYFNRTQNLAPVLANRKKLAVHLRLLVSFFVGGLTGALGFKYLGYVTTLPLSLILFLLISRHIVQDIRQQRRSAKS